MWGRGGKGKLKFLEANKIFPCVPRDRGLTAFPMIFSVCVCCLLFSLVGILPPPSLPSGGVLVVLRVISICFHWVSRRGEHFMNR